MQTKEPPFDCTVCRMEMADRLLDSAEGDITASIATFIIAFNGLSTAFGTDIINMTRKLMIELHESHGGYNDAA